MPPEFTEGVTVGETGVPNPQEGPALNTVTYSPFLKLCAEFRETVAKPEVLVPVALERVANLPNARTSAQGLGPKFCESELIFTVVPLSLMLLTANPPVP